MKAEPHPGTELRRWLRHLQSVDPSGLPILLARNRTQEEVDRNPGIASIFTPSKRTPWDQYTYKADWMDRQYISYRTVLRNEIVFDADYRQWGNNRRYTRRLLEVLNSYEVPYLITDSGGKGTHTHMAFDTRGLGGLYGYRQLRTGLWEFFLRQTGLEEKKGGWFGRFDPAPVRFSDTNQGSLVRVIGGLKARHKAPMDSIPEDPTQHPVVFPDALELYIPPGEVLDGLGLRPIIRECGQCPGPPGEYMPVYDQPEWYGCLKCGISPLRA